MPMAPPAPTNKLVVVIDDDPVILEAMDGLLRSWGYQVVTAASPDAALVLLTRHERPDLIISDFDLADGKTGVQAIEQLRGAFDIPALLITGGAEPGPLHRGGAARYHVMRKPVDPAALQTMLKRLTAGET